MAKNNAWDAELYEARHAFVWQFGESLIDVLAPQSGERILDLGCGTGQLTQKISESGADTIGLDASPEMIGQARQNYPRLQFVLQDAAAMVYREEFDAVFSNAALHWILNVRAVGSAISKALRPGGRLVAEFGGKGNISAIHSAVERAVTGQSGGAIPDSRTFFPSIGEYATILDETGGLEVRSALLFDRPTPLEGEDGMANWVRQFEWYRFESLTNVQKEAALAEMVDAVRPTLFRDGQWYADYRRLRITALKPKK